MKADPVPPAFESSPEFVSDAWGMGDKSTTSMMLSPSRVIVPVLISSPSLRWVHAVPANGPTVMEPSLTIAPERSLGRSC